MIPSSTRQEQGFTLIELLVVMIIISILMAVAVPTFLSQKNTALKTQATANIKNVVNAIESCASQITTGGYKDFTTGSTMNCSTSATLQGFEASLKNLQIQAAPLTAAAADVPKTQVVLDDPNTAQGYMVQKVIIDSGKYVFFAEIHTAAGDLHKWCNVGTPVPFTQDTATVNATENAATKTCKQGKW